MSSTNRTPEAVVGVTALVLIGFTVWALRSAPDVTVAAPGAPEVAARRAPERPAPRPAPVGVRTSPIPSVAGAPPTRPPVTAPPVDDPGSLSVTPDIGASVRAGMADRITSAVIQLGLSRGWDLDTREAAAEIMGDAFEESTALADAMRSGEVPRTDAALRTREIQERTEARLSELLGPDERDALYDGLGLPRP